MAQGTKRLLALLLALMMCISLLPAAALAEDEGEETGVIELVGDGTPDVPPEDPEALPPTDGTETVYSGQCGDDLTWSLDEDTGVLTITGGGDMWDWDLWMGTYSPWHDSCASITSLVLPDGLTSIGQGAFLSCGSLTSVVLPEGVTSIGDYAFSSCSSLSSVSLPASLAAVGDCVFQDCRALTGATIPEGVTKLSYGVFSGCGSLTRVTIPVSVTSIGDYAFSSCSSLSSVALPEGLTSIGNNAFTGCTGLRNVVFLGGPPDIRKYSFRNVTADAWYSDDGSWQEDDLQDYGGTLTWIPYDSRTAFASGKSLSLKGKIEVNFYLVLPDSLLADPGAYVAINGEKIRIGDARTREINGATRYVFSVKVKFSQLTDEQILRVYTGEDELVTLMDFESNDLTETGLVYRGQDYIEYVRSNSQDAGLVRVVNALSDVGSLAQALFNYNVESRVDLVNDLGEVTADMVADYALTHEAVEGAAIRYFGSSLLLQDVTTIRHYFKAAGCDVSGYTFTVDGVEVTPVEKDSFYYIDITGIAARDLDRNFRVEVSSSDGVVISLDYSAMSYAYSQISSGECSALTDLMKAVVLYANAANEYFAD